VADYGRADYTNLPAGLYRFRMEALDLMGVPTGRSYFPPGDGAGRGLENPLVLGRGWGGVVRDCTVGWRLAESRRMKRQVMDLERQRALEAGTPADCAGHPR
jgi:hypothetical protein